MGGSATDSATVRKRHKSSNRAAHITGLYRRGQVFWFQPPQRDGIRPKPFSLGTTDENEAIAKVLEFRRDPRAYSAGLWEAELDAYVRDRVGIKALTEDYAQNRRGVLMRFAQQYGIRSAAELTTAHCQKWHDDVAKNNAATAKHYIVHLRVFLQWLVENHRIKENVARKVRIPRQMPVARKTFVDKRGVRRLLAAARLESIKAKKTGDHALYRKALETEYILYCGFDASLRKREIIESRPEWFRVVPGALFVIKTPTFEPKNRKERSIPLTRRFRRFLNRFGMPEPFMIAPEKQHGPTVKGKPKRYRVDFKKSLKAFFRRHGYPDLTTHDERRSFASNRLIDNVNIGKIAKWAGNQVKTMEWHYGHLLPEDDDVNLGV